jgi:hypothetical protein
MLMHDWRDFRWDGNCLLLRTGRKMAAIEPDRDYAGMWRVRMPDGTLTDMVNLTRAKDAAVALASAVLNDRVAA